MDNELFERIHCFLSENKSDKPKGYTMSAHIDFCIMQDGKIMKTIEKNHQADLDELTEESVKRFVQKLFED